MYKRSQLNSIANSLQVANSDSRILVNEHPAEYGIGMVAAINQQGAVLAIVCSGKLRQVQLQAANLSPLQLGMQVHFMEYAQSIVVLAVLIKPEEYQAPLMFQQTEMGMAQLNVGKAQLTLSTRGVIEMKSPYAKLQFDSDGSIHMQSQKNIVLNSGAAIYLN